MAQKVVVAMSGGVDSSVAALLLKRQGYEPVGLFMRSGVAEGDGAEGKAAAGARTCCSAADAADGRRVAEQIGIPFYVLNFADQFQRLIDYFMDEYGHGRTPNPCIVCNRDLKFGRLFAHADAVGAEVVATGHYARLTPQPDGPPALRRGLDSAKDQSYVLFPIPRERLPRIVLPLGEMTKDETRRLAREAGLIVRDKEESQDVCFVAGDYIDFIRSRRPELLRPGPVVDETGREVGRHEGIAAFTIGQRKGLRIAFGEPRYVTRLDLETATVHVGRDEDLLAAGLKVQDVNWLLDAPAARPIEAEVQIRYRHAAAPAAVRADGAGAVVRFRESQRAVTPGQAAVFYQGDRVVGGGWIERRLDEADFRALDL